MSYFKGKFVKLKLSSEQILSYTYLICFSSIIVFLDQASKIWVRSNIQFGQRIIPLPSIAPFIGIVNWTNTGVAFGLFQNQGLLFTILSIVVSCAIIYYYRTIPRQDWLVRIALILQLGGAIGNLIDRLNFGEVTDFISIGFFPVFNVADSCISIGIVVLILGFWFQERRKKHDQILGLGNDCQFTPRGGENAESG